MVESLTEPMPPPRWWYWYVLVFSGVALAALFVGLFGLYSNDRNAARQAECFSSFAARFSNVSKEVRQAQVAVDEVQQRADAAAANRDAAFQKVLTFIVADDNDETKGLRLFARLTDSNRALVHERKLLVTSREHLQDVRAKHPIPEAPTRTRCELIGH